jgi:hypothetical protein
MRRLVYISLVIMPTLLAATIIAQQAPARPGSTPPPVVAAPDFTVQVWGDIVADFTARIQRYYDLREAAGQGLRGLVLTDDVDDIVHEEVSLARRIRQARGQAHQGEIFTPTISEQFRNALKTVVDETTREVIMDDNPGEFTRRIDARYPKTKSFSTVPANVLALLPRLPADIQYRFLGEHLILLDTRADVILDLMPCAIRCK